MCVVFSLKVCENVLQCGPGKPIGPLCAIICVLTLRSVLFKVFWDVLVSEMVLIGILSVIQGKKVEMFPPFFHIRMTR